MHNIHNTHNFLNFYTTNAVILKIWPQNVNYTTMECTVMNLKAHYFAHFL